MLTVFRESQPNTIFCMRKTARFFDVRVLIYNRFSSNFENWRDGMNSDSGEEKE
jgi:hypothetical protein